MMLACQMEGKRRGAAGDAQVGWGRGVSRGRCVDQGKVFPWCEPVLLVGRNVSRVGASTEIMLMPWMPAQARRRAQQASGAVRSRQNLKKKIVSSILASYR